MNTCNMDHRKSKIIQSTWQYLVKTGLTNATVRDLCRQEKISQSSLYYWFENKDDIWLSAGIYGFSRVLKTLFSYMVDDKNNIQNYFNTFLKRVEAYKQELRLAIQLTISPAFGERMRNIKKDFSFLYEKYAKELMTIFGCTQNQAETFIYSVISVVIDYAIWDDGEKTQMLLDNLYERIVNNQQREKVRVLC